MQREVHPEDGEGRVTSYAEHAFKALLTDRPIDWWETRQWRPMRDFPFTWIEFHVDGAGSGEGSMSVATRITYDPAREVLVPETFESQPARLQDVRLERRR